MNAMNAAVETQKELLRKRKKPAAKNDDGSSPTPKTPDGKDTKPTFKVIFQVSRLIDRIFKRLNNL